MVQPMMQTQAVLHFHGGLMYHIEQVFAFCVMMIGITGSAVVVADVLNIVSSLDNESAAQRERVDAIDRLMK